ncbi:MAG: hypothetical protein CMB29_00320 [Euryarchaeota archaeon]|nr:hypothetical protein [Euryarchaeota archaeon]DAC31090.1 MAG TPA: hypothetical protein D7H81_01895 [Candidatus Poseidoniales archaeon]HII44772.1 S8 family serine peptidase [Candidatus Poseidoniaceae archaeon]|tara:strand:+ start:3434 stop:4648 length:1215 start_codon:yes stop_codon:yes gene_type:complete
MGSLDTVELLPEPDDERILSAIDPSAVGFQDEWRAEVTGWAPAIPTPIKRVRTKQFIITNGILFTILAVLMLWIWQSGFLLVDLPPPKSEWAAQQAGFSDASLDGLTGEGVRVCIVDTGIDLSNPAFNGVEIVFEDMIGDSSTPVDYGFLAHGTLMSGLLIAQSHQIGMAPNIKLGMVAALGDDGTGKNTADESVVAQAINWCIDNFNADIISLSLGGSQTDGMTREGPSVSVTRKAVDMGIFVVAAAGNDGGIEDDGKVSVPSNVARAISVGASVRGGEVWENSSMGSQSLADGEQRDDPHLKPEIIAPGESIISTGRGNTWYTSSGTSDATVFVTAALALILEDQPNLKPNSNSDGACIDAVKEALRLSTASGGDVHSNVAGYGELHAGDWLDATRKLPDCQ